MLMPFEWVVGDSSKDHTVTAPMFYDVLATVRYTTLRGITRSATATSKIDGVITEWGTQAKCDAFRADGDGAKTIWYLSKALNYVLKDVVLDAGDDSPEAWRHLASIHRWIGVLSGSRDAEMPLDQGK